MLPPGCRVGACRTRSRPGPGPSHGPGHSPSHSASWGWLLLCACCLLGGALAAQPPLDAQTYEDLLRYREVRAAALQPGPRTQGPQGGAAPLPLAAVVSYYDPSGHHDSSSLADSDSSVAQRLRRACSADSPLACTEGAVIDVVDRTLSPGSYQLTSAISLEPVPGAVHSLDGAPAGAGSGVAGESSSSNTSSQSGKGRAEGRARRRGVRSVIEPHEVAEHIVDRMDRFARSHVVKVKLGQLARELTEQRKYSMT